MRSTALAPLRDTLLVALGLGSCTPRPAETPPVTDGRPPVAPTQPRPTPAVAHGYVAEEDGTVHRASAPRCAADNPRPACVDPGQHSSCTADSECSGGANPRCVQSSGQVGPFCQCDFSCTTDSDCNTGELCVCGEALGGAHHSMCVTAQCQQDSDCASGVCGVSVHHNGCSETRVLACRTATDTCTRNADCPAPEVCAYDAPSATWGCKGRTCVIGRPLLVDGAARTARGIDRGDWQRALPVPTDLDPATTAALAAHWHEVAALEHASVASFARFTLELLALGAPPDLLAAAQQAGLDEVEHARLAYALASRFAGRPLGPGPLCTADLALDRPLAAFVTALVHEGCIGETLGAAEAELLAERADPGLATLLRRIATDETGHAALAWQTLRWLHDRHGEVVRQAARAALAAAELDLVDDLDDRPAATSAAWGLLPRRTLLAHRRRTLDAVVRPILGAVLGADESTDLS